MRRPRNRNDNLYSSRPEGRVRTRSSGLVFLQADALRESNIDPPLLTELFLKLRERGITIDVPIHLDQAVNDLVAAGCADVLLRQKVKIPEDISISGFGDTMLSQYFLVPLTTVNQPKHRLGNAAMDSMLQLLQGQRPEPKRLSSGLPNRSTRTPAD